MSVSNKGSHLTKSDREIIQRGIENGSTKVAIALILGKEKSTIGKEIKEHRTLSKEFNFALECKNYQKCKFGRECTLSCPTYEKFYCSRRDRSPGACNGCLKYKSCRFNKYKYSATTADNEYREKLVDSRVGVNLTFNEAKEMGSIIKPLITQGQSLYAIVNNHPELGVCERTLYNYIEGGIFACVGLHNVDLRCKVSRKISKKEAATYKKRENKEYLKGRTYNLYEDYMTLHPNVPIVQMDTVYNDGSNGPFLQTFKFLDYGFIFSLYHEIRDSQSMLDGVNILHSILGDLFIPSVHILLTDRGTEFVRADEIEMDKGLRRTKVYYCDPMASGQKGSLENKHKELRYVLPKVVDLIQLGLIDQTTLNKVLSHVNSYPLESLKGKTPIEMIRFLNPKLLEKFIDFGIQEIEKDKVVLKPYLLKK